MKFGNDPKNLEVVNKIIDLYKSGYSSSYIAKEFKRSDTGIRDILRQNGIKIRNKYEYHQIYKVNKDYFKQIDSHSKAQILGMIGADGNVCGGRFSISLIEKDRDYLNWMKTELEYEGNLGFHLSKTGHQNVCKLAISQHQIIEDLKRLGVVERKSLILNFPTENQVPKEFVNSYILGYFEGDGCITSTLLKGKSNRSFQINFCGL